MRYDIRDEFAGKTVPCKQCGAKFRVPDPAFDGFEFEHDARPARAARRASPDDDYDYTPRNRAPRRRSSSGAPKAVLIGLAVLIGISVCAGAGYLVYRYVGTSDEAEPDSEAKPSLQAATFPDLLEPKILPGSGAKVYFVDCGAVAGSNNGPGSRMKMRVYLPAGDHAAKSLGCVLVAPAGTTLLHGNDMDNDDYHDETLPYVQAGYAVVFYSIDGPLNNQNNSAELAAAYKKFKAAEAGVVNGRRALEFVLAKLPQVDPQRIYSAGHSSAGTLSLLLTAKEPRIAAGIAYAPATDVESRLRVLRSKHSAQQLLPGLKDFLHESSPRNHVDKYRQPLFVFHARSDTNEPILRTNRFIQKLKDGGKKVTYSTTVRGGHYRSMINEGIPRAIAWLKQLPVEQGKTYPIRKPARHVAGQEPPPSNSGPRTTQSRFPNGTPGSRFRSGFPRMPARSRTRSRSGSGTTRTPTLSFEVKSFKGRGTPEQAARRALSRIPIIDSSTIRYDVSARKVFAKARAASLSTAAAKSALQREGFVVGATSISFR